MLENITSLKERWFELYPTFTQLREDILATVTRWEWANGPRYDPRPFYFQRDTAKGRLLRRRLAEGVREEGVWRNGYDDQNRCRIVRDDSGWESLYTFGSGYIEIFGFQTYYNVFCGVSRLYFEAGRPTYYIEFLLQGHPEAFHSSAEELWQQALQNQLHIAIRHEDYHYSDNHIVEINHKAWQSSWHPGDKGPHVWESEFHLDYLANGQLSRITFSDPGNEKTKTMYRKRATGETLTSLTEQTKTKLIEMIPQVIKKAKFAEPLYCLQLHFIDIYLFPPKLLPGFESHRQQVLATEEPFFIPNHVWAMVWDFSDDENEPYPPFPIDDAETLRLCEILQIEVSVRGNHARYQRGVRTLYQLAQALNQLDWTAYAPVTSDFIVFAYDQEEFWQALRLSGATPEQMRDWRKRKLL